MALLYVILDLAQHLAQRGALDLHAQRLQALGKRDVGAHHRRQAADHQDQFTGRNARRPGQPELPPVCVFALSSTGAS